MNTIIKNALIITNDYEMTQGNIHIINDKIAYIGSDSDGFQADIIIDGNDKLVLPGLINTHTHIGMTGMRNYADDVALFDWLNNYIFPVEDAMTVEDIEAATYLGMAEMIRFGTTSFCDMYLNAEVTIKAAIKSGMRANVSRGLVDIDSEKNGDMRLLENFNLFSKYNGEDNGRIIVDLGPHAVYTCSLKYLEKVVKTAYENNIGVHVHMSETEDEVNGCIEKHNMTPTELLNKAGIFANRTVAAHGVHLNDNDIEILKNKPVTIAHNPVSNLKLGSGIADICKYLEHGLNVSLGTDGVASNNNHSMFEEMKFAALLPKGVSKIPSLMNAKDILKIATISGAKALGREDTGILKEGYKADLIMLDLNEPNMFPVNNAISGIVYSALGYEVKMTMVDGKVLYNNGEYKTIDIEKAKYDIKRFLTKLKKA